MLYHDLVRSMRPEVYIPLGSRNTITPDRSGYNLPGTHQGTVSPQGPSLGPHGPSSNGVTTSIDVWTSHSARLNASQFTVMCWLQQTTTSQSSNGGLVMRSGLSTDFYQWRLDSNQMNFYPASGLGLSVANAVTDLRPHLVAVVVTGSANFFTFYRDATVIGSGTTAGVPVPTSGTSGLVIGNHGGGTIPYRGMLAHVAYFSRALTAGEIRRLWLAGAGRERRRAA